MRVGDRVETGTLVHELGCDYLDPRSRGRASRTWPRLHAVASWPRGLHAPEIVPPRLTRRKPGAPGKLKYTESHEWVADNGDGTVAVGITAIATEQLGDLVYVELPQTGASRAARTSRWSNSPGRRGLRAGGGRDRRCQRRSRRSPREPALRQGWLFKIKVADRAELDGLLARDAYAKSAGV